jgi:hypothetical protein
MIESQRGKLLRSRCSQVAQREVGQIYERELMRAGFENSIVET